MVEERAGVGVVKDRPGVVVERVVVVKDRREVVVERVRVV